MTTTRTYTDPSQELRVLTILPLWASLLASGEKKIETRAAGFTKGYRGWIAIHAGAATPDLKKPNAARTYAGIKPETELGLPRALILAVVRFYDAATITALLRDSLTDRELAFGDYRDGRVALFTDCPQRLLEPIPWKGAQGLRYAPEELRRQIAEQLRAAR